VSGVCYAPLSALFAVDLAGCDGPQDFGNVGDDVCGQIIDGVPGDLAALVWLGIAHVASPRAAVKEHINTIAGGIVWKSVAHVYWLKVSRLDAHAYLFQRLSHRSISWCLAWLNVSRGEAEPAWVVVCAGSSQEGNGAILLEEDVRSWDGTVTWAHVFILAW
jgi:hypothetical protein